MNVKLFDIKLFVSAILLFAGVSLSAEQPYWWDNPHRDDELAMYERGMATNAATEQDAERKAVLAAKEMLIERIGIGPALEAAGLASAPEYAIVNFEVAGSGTEKTGKIWTAWVLLKYPIEEKQKIMDRWNASIALMNDLKKPEASIPVQFALSLGTADGRLQYRDGESVSFIVQSDTDCYLLLLDHQGDGTTVLLFPNRFQPNSFVRRGQSVRIPAEDMHSFSVVVGEPFGDDRVEAIASTKKSDLHAKFSELVEHLPAQESMAIMSRGLFIKELGNVIGDASDKNIRWSKAEISLSTYQK